MNDVNIWNENEKIDILDKANRFTCKNIFNYFIATFDKPLDKNDFEGPDAIENISKKAAILK